MLWTNMLQAALCFLQIAGVMLLFLVFFAMCLAPGAACHCLALALYRWRRWRYWHLVILAGLALSAVFWFGLARTLNTEWPVFPAAASMINGAVVFMGWWDQMQYGFDEA